MNKDTVLSALSALVAMNFIERITRPGETTIYRILPRNGWATTPDRKEGSPPKVGRPERGAGWSPENEGHHTAETEGRDPTETRGHEGIPVRASNEGDPGEGNPSTRAPASPERGRNPLFDALAESTGSIPSEVVGAAARACGVALAAILKASPDVTVDGIRRRAQNYATHFRDAALTPSALAKHWALCHAAKSVRARNEFPPGYYDGNGGWDDPKQQ